MVSKNTMRDFFEISKPPTKTGLSWLGTLTLFGLLCSGMGAVQAQEPHPLPLVTASAQSLVPPLVIISPVNHARIHSSEPLLRWKVVSGAAKYKITIIPDEGTPIEQTIRDRQLNNDAPPGERGTYAFTLSIGKNYSWQVSALDSTGVVLATSRMETFTTVAGNLYERLKSDSNLTVQRSFDLAGSKDATEAATIGYSNPVGQESDSLTAEIAIGKKKVIGGAFGKLLSDASVETRLTSVDKNKGDNMARFRLSHTLPEIFKHDEGSVSLKYEGDKNFFAQRLLVETLYTSTAGSLGKYTPTPPFLFGRADPKRIPRVQTMIQPYLGLDAGRTLRGGVSSEKEDFLLRLLTRLRVDFRLNDLSKRMGLSEVVFFADDTYRYLPLEDNPNFNYVTAGADFFITKDFAFSARYRNGKDAPKFKQAESYSFSFGVRL